MGQLPCPACSGGGAGAGRGRVEAAREKLHEGSGNLGLMFPFTLINTKASCGQLLPSCSPSLPNRGKLSSKGN